MKKRLTLLAVLFCMINVSCSNKKMSEEESAKFVVDYIKNHLSDQKERTNNASEFNLVLLVSNILPQFHHQSLLCCHDLSC